MSYTRERRLNEAMDSLNEAKTIKDARVSNLAVLTKLYHSMIYAIMGLFEIDDIGTLTHDDLINRFEREYILTGKVRKEYNEALRFAYNITHECDCGHMKEPADSDIEDLMPIAEEFVREVEG
jgi:uncharacterized protein (UPF0332 family)